jgi:hypothetical protein
MGNFFHRLAFLMVLVLFFAASVSQTFANFPLQKLEQQITIVNDEFSTMNLTDSPTDNSLGLVHYDSNNYTSPSVYFEVLMKCDTCTGGNQQASATLYTKAGASVTTVNVQSGSYTLGRSGSLALSAGDYAVRFKVDANAGTAYIKAARLIIVDNTSKLTKTETQIEMGSYQNAPSLSGTALLAPKYYMYDQDQFTPAPTAHLDATFKSGTVTNTISFYFNNYDTGTAWSTSPGNMTDGNTSTYASTSSGSETQQLISSNFAIQSGTITKVEARVYGYQTNNQNGRIILTPVFGGTTDGTDHPYVAPVDNGNWSADFDITSDTNAPSTWTWSDLYNLDMKVKWEDNGSGNTAYVSKVEYKVTYLTSGTAYVELYNRTNSTVVTTAQTDSRTYTLVSTGAFTTNWDTANDDEYEIRTYTSDADFPVYLANAKIVLTQSDGTNGISSVETVQDYITTTRTETNSSYTSSAYYNKFDPTHFLSNKYRFYLESTMKTSAGTGTAMLYRPDDTDPIDSPTSSEITTTSTDFVRRRSVNFVHNTDWPTGSVPRIDTIVRNTTGDTTTITSSRLIIQTAYIDPSVTLTIEGVDSGETHNGVTTNITSTITSMPFSHISVGDRIYGAHKFTVTLNEEVTGYVLYVQLGSPFQGNYPANNIDPFAGSGATWAIPQAWSTPNGSSANSNSGWFGANITNKKVTGWSGDTTALFGPVTTSPVAIMRNFGDTTDTDYITYGLEVNVLQPSDTYSTTIQYLLVPTY